MACALLLLGFASPFIPPSYAMPWMGAMETAKSLVATTGISPIPTEAPGLNGIPKELKPRGNIQYPPPLNWCGLIGGDDSDILSCASSDTCSFSDTAIGCCLGIGACSGIPTTCAGYEETCGPDCRADPLVLKCADPSLPHCHTYSFYGGTYLYNCQSYSYYRVSSVEFLDHYYRTAIGSSYIWTASFASQAAETSKPGSARATPGTDSKGDNSTDVDDGDGNSGLGTAAVGGVAAAAGFIICLLLGLLLWFCMRRRKRARLAASQQLAQHAPPTFNPQGGVPMKQQQQYHSVPQQDSNVQGNGQYQPTQDYSSNPTDPSKESAAYSNVSPIASPVPSNVDPAARPFSAVSSQHPSEGGQTKQVQQHLGPPVPGYAGPLAGGGVAQDYYKQPQSPNITEVDGTRGNPGVPRGSRPGVNEVDGTQGNPGVPYTQQQYPGPYEMH